MHPFLFLLTCLAVWRITHLLAEEDGPWDIIFRLRKKAGVSFWGKLMDCFYCLSIWVAALVAPFYGTGLKEIVLLGLALSGGACLLQKLTTKNDAAPATFFKED